MFVRFCLSCLLFLVSMFLGVPYYLVPESSEAADRDADPEHGQPERLVLRRDHTRVADVPDRQSADSFMHSFIH